MKLQTPPLRHPLKVTPPNLTHSFNTGRSNILTAEPTAAIPIQTTAGTLSRAARLPQGSEYRPLAWARSELMLYLCAFWMALIQKDLPICLFLVIYCEDFYL